MSRVTPPDLEHSVATVLDHVTRELLLESVCGMVDIASPTGGERPLATWIADTLTAENLGDTFGMPIVLTSDEGRYAARAAA